MNPYIGDRPLDPPDDDDCLWPDYDPEDDPTYDPFEPNEEPDL